MIVIQNSGSDILSTNYYESDHAKRGECYCSFNEGKVRLLVPPVIELDVARVHSDHKIKITLMGGHLSGEPSRVKILFFSSSGQEVLSLETAHFTGMPTSSNIKFLTLAVWTQNGKKTERACEYVVVPKSGG